LTALRDALSQDQRDLIEALLGKGPVPGGFTGAELLPARESLLLKRRRGVAKAWPALAASLGVRFGPAFAAYATQHPGTPNGGSAADGWGFAKHLEAERVLKGAARLELAAFELAHRVGPRGLSHRRFAVKVVARPGRGYAGIGVHIRGLGTRWLFLGTRDRN